MRKRVSGTGDLVKVVVLCHFVAAKELSPEEECSRGAAGITSRRGFFSGSLFHDTPLERWFSRLANDTFKRGCYNLKKIKKKPLNLSFLEFMVLKEKKSPMIDFIQIYFL